MECFAIWEGNGLRRERFSLHTSQTGMPAGMRTPKARASESYALCMFSTCSSCASATVSNRPGGPATRAGSAPLTVGATAIAGSTPSTVGPTGGRSTSADVGWWSGTIRRYGLTAMGTRASDGVCKYESEPASQCPNPKSDMYGQPHNAMSKSSQTSSSRMQCVPSSRVNMVRTTASTCVSLPSTPRMRTLGLSCRTTLCGYTNGPATHSSAPLSQIHSHSWSRDAQGTDIPSTRVTADALPAKTPLASASRTRMVTTPGRSRHRRGPSTGTGEGAT